MLSCLVSSRDCPIPGPLVVIQAKRINQCTGTNEPNVMIQLKQIIAFPSDIISTLHLLTKNRAKYLFINYLQRGVCTLIFPFPGV